MYILENTSYNVYIIRLLELNSIPNYYINYLWEIIMVPQFSH